MASKGMMAQTPNRKFSHPGAHQGRRRIPRLYRALRSLVAVWLIALLTIPSSAQLRSSKLKKGPRAIAVVRWQTNAQGKAVPRLLPVLVIEEGKYYDANLYRAAPRPMALEPGVVYEAQDKGEALGYFTVRNARSGLTRQWYGLGEWESIAGAAAPELRERPQTAELVKEVPKGTTPAATESVDDREIKKKKTVYDEEGKEIPEGKEPAEDKPPTMKRQEGDIDRLPQVAPPKKEAPKPEKAEDDPERPRLKRETPGATPAAKAQERVTEPAAAPAKKAGDDDPNRPILRRGKGQQKTGTSESEESAGTPVPARVQARGDVSSLQARQPSGFATRTFEAVAVSDAEDTESHPDFRFRWTESEREELTARMRQLAEQEAQKFVTSKGETPAAPRTPVSRTRTARTQTPRTQTPRTQGNARAATTLTDTQIAGLDLDSNNYAELVYSGRASLDSGKTLFVTLVARTDVDGNPRKLFSAVTTSDRLDVTPRLEFVDVVDADGDHRGELLFRRIREGGAEFVLYRVGVDAITELFHGGNGE